MELCLIDSVLGETPVIAIPGSKSVAARALVLKFVHRYDTLLENLPTCDDTMCLEAALRKLKCALSEGSDVIDSDDPVSFYLGEGGTTLRFFLAIVASLKIHSLITFDGTLAKRPLIPLIDALHKLNDEIRIVESGEDGDCRLDVRGAGIYIEDEIEVDSSVSSQFVSALMLASPLWKGEGSVKPSPDSVSSSYLQMTTAIMEEFKEAPAVYTVEGDWSAAAFFYEYVLLSRRKVILKGVSIQDESLQEDSRIVEIMRQAGVDTTRLKTGDIMIEYDDRFSGVANITLDLSDTPDMVPALAFAFALSDIRFRFDGIGHLRYKESNRMEALKSELVKLGYVLMIGEESLSWEGDMIAVDKKLPICFDGHNDHRMVMAEAISVVKTGRLRIEGAECVSKSFPSFFNEVEKLGICRERYGY